MHSARDSRSTTHPEHPGKISPEDSDKMRCGPGPPSSLARNGLSSWLVLLLALQLGAAQTSFREIPVGQTATHNNVRVTLEKLALTGPPTHQNLLATFRITDTAGRPLTLVRNARMTLVEAKRSSDPLFGQSAPGRSTVLNLNLSPLQEAHLKQTQTISLELQAGRLPPTHTWRSLPVQPIQAAPPAIPYFQNRSVIARVEGVYQETAAALLGNRAIPTLRAEVVEQTRQLTDAEGFIEIVAPGLRTKVIPAERKAEGVLYSAEGRVAEDSLLPTRVTLHYYSAPDVARALKSYRFTFRVYLTRDGRGSL